MRRSTACDISPYKPDTGERERQHAEEAREPREQQLLGVQAIDLFVLRPQVQHGERRVDVAHGARMAEKTAVAAPAPARRGAPQSSRRRRAAAAPEGRWSRACRRGARVFRVGGDAHDLDLISRCRPNADLAANRVLAAKIGAHERLVDDGDPRRGGVVASGEAAAEHERQLHRAEEIRRQPVGVDDRRRAGRRRVPGTAIRLFWRTRESRATLENVAARTPGSRSRRSCMRACSAAYCSRTVAGGRRRRCGRG